jgi:hypothetical protein
MTFTSWLKYDLDIKKILICVKVMLIYVNITDRQTHRHIKSIVRNLTKCDDFENRCLGINSVCEFFSKGSCIDIVFKKIYEFL